MTTVPLTDHLSSFSSGLCTLQVLGLNEQFSCQQILHDFLSVSDKQSINLTILLRHCSNKEVLYRPKVDISLSAETESRPKVT